MAETKAPTQNQQPAPARADQRVRFVVEIADDRNRNVNWPLDQGRVLRGRWTKDNLPGVSFDDAFAHMPNIPGMLLIVRERTARILDPLSLPENERLLEKARAVCKDAFKVSYAPEKEVTIHELGESELKSWCYWVRRLLDARECVLISGAVPEMQAVFAMPGKIACENHNSSRAQLTEAGKHERDHHRYVPPSAKDRAEESLAVDLSAVRMD